MDNPHVLVPRKFDGSCESCGRHDGQGCNCSASYRDWEENRFEQEYALYEDEIEKAWRQHDADKDKDDESEPEV